MKVKRSLSALDPKVLDLREGTKGAGVPNPLLCAQQGPVSLCLDESLMLETVAKRGPIWPANKKAKMSASQIIPKHQWNYCKFLRV